MNLEKLLGNTLVMEISDSLLTTDAFLFSAALSRSQLLSLVEQRGEGYGIEGDKDDDGEFGEGEVEPSSEEGEDYYGANPNNNNGNNSKKGGARGSSGGAEESGREEEDEEDGDNPNDGVDDDGGDDEDEDEEALQPQKMRKK